MSNVKKNVIAAVAAVAVCVAAITAVCLIVFGGGKNDVSHVIVEQPAEQPEVIKGELDISLVRRSLETVTLNKRGSKVKQVDSKKKDFTRSQENVFGISDQLIGPGCYFLSDMVIQNLKQGDFEYWIEIVPVGGGKQLADQIEITVSMGGNVTVKRILGGGLTTEILGGVKSGTESQFSVKLEYLKTDDNNQTQNSSLSFDMVVHARLINL